MRSDAVKAAFIVSASGLIASVILVLGMRWAIGSALAAHLPELNRTLSATGGRVEDAIQQSTSALGDRVATTGEAVSDSVERSADTLRTASERVAEVIDDRSTALNGTLLRSFEQPMLIAAPEGLGIKGAQDADAPAVQVDASVSLGEEDGETAREE